MKLVRQHMLKRGCAIPAGGMSGGRGAAILGMQGRRNFAETRYLVGGIGGLDLLPFQDQVVLLSFYALQRCSLQVMCLGQLKSVLA